MSNNQNYVETMSERKININQSGASIGVGYSENVEANQLGGTINNYPSERAEADSCRSSRRDTAASATARADLPHQHHNRADGSSDKSY
ncbi:hypothetical protein [Cylindrospermum stagnale]|uniref:hypothetical protein n=1 Tax=Cylindrospermum stagnale TaxID=142864 RepID=UPI00030BCC6C|nr:hypothetical protein [Cylindrospermum stagnale]